MSAETSMSVLTARPAVAALEERGIDPARVLRTAELSSDALASVDARLPCGSVLRLWEAAAAAAGDPSFGVHVAEKLPTGAYDVYEHILAAAETVGDGLARLARYIPLLHDHSTLRLIVEPAHARLVRRVPAMGPQYDEFTMTVLLVRSRQASGVDWRPERVTFQHDLTHDDAELSRVFGCPLAFGAAETELLVPHAVLDLPHPRADATLLSVLTGHVDPLLESSPARGVLLARVSGAIARRMSSSLPTLAEAAAAVRIPERTLQRRLAEEGVSFSVLVDDVRRNLALEDLANPSLSVTEIALRLQFADPAAFYRAFKRWTGESPTTYRRRFL